MTVAESDEDNEGESSEWGIALVTGDEICCFSRNDVLLDNEASLNIFNNAVLLTDLVVLMEKKMSRRAGCA